MKEYNFFIPEVIHKQQSESSNIFNRHETMPVDLNRVPSHYEKIQMKKFNQTKRTLEDKWIVRGRMAIKKPKVMVSKQTFTM